MRSWIAPYKGGYCAKCAVCNKMTYGDCGHKQPPHGPPPTNVPATAVKR